MSSNGKYLSSELEPLSVTTGIDFQVSFAGDPKSKIDTQDNRGSILTETQLCPSTDLRPSLILTPKTSDVGHEASSYHSALLDIEIPNSSLSSSTASLDSSVHRTGFRLSFLGHYSSPETNHEDRRSSLSYSDRSAEYDSTVRSVSICSNSTEEIECISNNRYDASKRIGQETSSAPSTQVIDESFEQRNFPLVRRFSMIEDNFQSIHTFSHPIQQRRSTLETHVTNPISQLDGSPVASIRRKPVAISLQSNPLSSQSLSQTRISFNRPIGLRTMSSAHELRALRAPQRDASFDSWLEDVCTRACANSKRNSNSLQHQSSFSRLSLQSPVSTGAPIVVLKEEIAALKTAVISLNGLQDLMSQEAVGSQEIVRDNSSSSCGTTACEVATHDLVQPVDHQYQRKLLDESATGLAQRCTLKTQSGNPITFKEIIGRSHRTVVIFIRFFWCALCQTYVEQISKSFPKNSEAYRNLKESGTRVVLIGTGDWRMIASYREMLNCPFEIYSDPSSNKLLFKQFGLERTFKSGKSSEKGDYLAEINIRKIITQSIFNINKMPFRNPGSFTQLGGEFCFESNLKIDTSSIIAAPSIRVKNKRFSHLSLRPAVSVFKPKPKMDDNGSTDRHYQKAHAVTDPSVKCVYANRMTNSRDHGTLKQLFDSIGLKIFD